MATTSVEASAVSVPLPVSVPVAVSSTRITHVNIDCLEKVFDHLSFEDLLSVADVHTQLRKAADLVYGLKYKNKIVSISYLRSTSNDLKVSFNDYNRMFIYGLKSVLKTFRCFGHNVSHVEILSVFDHNINLSHMMCYIGEYCSDRLEYIDFMTQTGGALNRITKPLNGVKKLKIWDHGLTTNLLNEKFPKLERLQIIYGCDHIQNGQCNAAGFENIEKYFPYLDQMKIESDYAPDTYSLLTYQRTENVVDLAALTNTKSFTEYKNEFPNLRFPFEHLDEICLQFNFRNDDEFYNFFRKYPSITNFIFTHKHYNKYKFEAKDLNVVKLANALPWLKQIDVRCCKFTPNAVIQWLDHFKSLDKFQFYLETHSEYMDLQSYLGDEWRSICSIDGDKQICNLERNRLRTN